MSKLDILRKIIREEVTKAIEDAMPKMLHELNQNKIGKNNVIKEMKKQEFPITLNTAETYQKKRDTVYTNSSPLNKLLNETAMSMQDDDVEMLSFNTDNVSHTSFFQPKEAAVGDVNGMLATARPSSALEMVQINEVPDYSGLMKSLKDKGAI